MKRIAILILFSLEAEAAVHLLKGSLIEKRQFKMGTDSLVLVYDSHSLNNGRWGFGWCSNLEETCVQYYNLKPFTGVPPTFSHSSTTSSTLLSSQGEWIRLSFLNQNLIRLQHSLLGDEHYQYDSLHNLTQILFFDKTMKTITYDSQKDLVLSVQGRGICFEKYIYTLENKQNISTSVHRFCRNKEPQVSKYDFFYKVSALEEDRLLKLNVVHL